MPMPQRKSKPQSFQSNNSFSSHSSSSLLVSGSSNNSSGSTNSSIGNSSNNGRQFYAPPANSYHHHHQQQCHYNLARFGPIAPPLPPPLPPSNQPPLITDTLTACLDVNGTYVCTSYSPRCYIIQKVTPTSVTVTPTEPIGLAVPQIPPVNLGIPNCIHSHSHSHSHRGGGSGSSSSTSSSGFHHPSPRYPNSSQYSSSSTSTPKQQMPRDSSDNSSAKSTPTTSQSTHNNSNEKDSPSSTSSSSATDSVTMTTANTDTNSNNTNSQTKSETTLQEKEADTDDDGNCSTNTSGRAFMNGEVSCSVPPGDSSPMGVAPQCSDNSGTLTTDTRLLNGVSDGLDKSEEHMALNKDGELKDRGLVAGQYKPPHNDQQSESNDEDQPQLPSNTPIEELRQLLLTQLEYYFSHENLSNDKFLVSQMDSDQYVYISTVANFNMIKKLSNNLDLITDVLKESKHVQVHSDGKRVRPVSNRTVVILRGIPQHTPIEEIKALFQRENSPRCNHCEFAFNDSWYLSFDSDDEAVRAHKYLREDVREFKGQPVMARIKSRPITLLAQGVGVNPTAKNGYNPPPPAALPQYMSAPYVSTGTQPGPNNVAAAQIFPAGQQLTSTVFTIPSSPYASYGAQVPWTGYYDLNSGVFSINGMQQQPQTQPSPNYNKGMHMGPRHRNAKSETESYYRLPRGPRRNGENSNNTSGTANAHQYGGGGNHHRKNSGPSPLMGMAPGLNSHHSSHSHNHSHAHNHAPVVSSGSSANANRNTGHYNNNNVGGVSNVPHSSTDSYHYSNSRPYRGSDNRPRSSLGPRKPPRTYDDDANYENHNHNSAPSANRGNPSSRVMSASAVSPQPVNAQGNSPQHQSAKTNFDLEASAFPPLPGAGNASVKNDDTPFEGRLSDVVKGLKNLKTQAGEKEEVGINTVHSELVVNTDEPRSSTYVVSAASPTKEMNLHKDLSSQSSSTVNKKEFREVGVGSADDNHQNRAACSRDNATSGGKGKETDDKSTTTDTALLHGDHPANRNKSDASKKDGSGDSYQQGGSDNYRKPIPQSAKLPSGNKKGGANQHGSSTEVPYFQRDAKSGATSGCDSLNSGGGDRSGNGATNMAKTQADNNGRVGACSSSASQRNNINTNDKDAFPAPSFVKSNVPSTKLFSNVADQSKEVTRDSDRKDGDSKKLSDENNCSNDREAGPVRLSYAQVAQSRKDKMSPAVNTQQQQVSSSSSSVVSQSGSASSNAQSSSLMDEKKRPVSEAKDARPMPKTNAQRGSSTGGTGGFEREGDRNRGFRRYRNRISSEHSQDGGGNYGNGGRPPRRNRSPK